MRVMTGQMLCTLSLAIVACLLVSCTDVPEERKALVDSGEGVFSTLITILPLDGGETGLGIPGIAIAPGSGMVVAGTGTDTQPATISIDVPGAVQQALLYWDGEHGPGDGDDTLDVDFNGTPQTIMGDLIGGPEFFFAHNGQVFVSTYRADVTASVVPGANALTITGMDFDVQNLGAGLLVIYDDGSSQAMSLRDGQDLAFAHFSPPLDATVPQQFVFSTAGAPRTATLHLFVSDVGEGRPNRIRIEVAGVGVVDLDDLLGSNDGPHWDTLTIPVDVPAGSDSVTVEVISLEDGSGILPASLGWLVAGFSITEPYCGDGILDPSEECDDGNDIDTDGCRNDCTLPYCGDGFVDPGEECDDGNNLDGDGCSADCTMEMGGGQGCTPGYWKQPHHADSWVGYSSDQLFDVVFGVDAPGDKTLLETLKTGGGKQHALGRHAVAALLNAANPEVSYFHTEVNVIDLVQEAYATGRYNGIKDLLEEENEQGCPLN